ncbi:MAG: invasin domain 3-containing protein [Candidatus Edwardsbacteria bacterium]|nr:invasin domain 3-containing protein [Candidatus Edwardsbacteria bacterium]
MPNRTIRLIGSLLLVICLLPLLWLACSKKSPTAPPADTTPPPTTTGTVRTVIVTPDSVGILVAATSQFSAQARDSAGNTLSGITFNWTSSDTTVAKVNTAGLVTGVDSGKATITATAAGTTVSGAGRVVVMRASTTGSIYVASNKDSTYVYVDATYRGLAPITVSPISQGDHTVLGTRNGYSNITQNVTVVAGQTTNVSLQFMRVGRIVISANPLTIQADGQSRSSISANITDDNNNPMNGTLVRFRIVGLGGINPGMITGSDTTDDGNVSATITAGTNAGQVRVYAVVAGDSNSVTVTYKPNAPYTVNLSANPTTVRPDGISYSTLTASVYDAYGNTVAPGTSVNFNTTLGSIAEVLPTDGLGIATARLIAPTKTGMAQVTATSGSATTQTTVTFSDVGASLSLAADQSSILANGQSKTTITATLTDGGVGIANQTIAFSTTAGAIAATAVTNSQGQAAVDLYSVASSTDITASVTASAFTKGDKVANITTVTMQGVTMTLAANPASIMANGASNSTVTATLTYTTGGGPLAGVPVSFASTLGTITASALTNASGAATATLTSGTSLGTATVTATYGNTFTKLASIEFTQVTAGSIILSAGQNTLTANGTSSTTITATVKDAMGQLMPNGTIVAFTTTMGSITTSAVTANGVATANLTAGTATGADTVRASSGAANSQIVIGFVAGPAAAISLAVSRPTIIPDGKDTTTITATVRDAYNNSVDAGTMVNFASTLGAISNVTATNSAGAASAVLTSGTKNGTATVTVTAGTGSAQTSVVFSDASTTLTLVSSADTILANGQTTAVLTARLTVGGLPIAGQTIGFSSTYGAIAASAVTDASGYARAALTSIASETTVGATITAGAFTAKSATSVPVVFRGVSFVLASSADSITANGAATATVTATLIALNGGGPISGVPVSFASTLGTITASALTNASGAATVTLRSSSNAVGTATVTATYGATLVKTKMIEFTPIVIGTVNVSAAVSSLIADGTSSTTVTATVKDNTGYPAPDGTPVSFTAKLGSVTPSATTTGGAAAAILTSSTTIGTDTIIAMAGTVADTVLVSYIGGSPTTITLIATSDSLQAGSNEVDTVRATVYDATGHLVSDGTIVNFTTTLGNITNSTTTTGGIATAYLTPSTSAGYAVIQALSGTASKSLTVRIIAGGANSIVMTTSCPTIQVSGTGGNSTADLTATVKDKNGNPVPDGTPVSFTIMNGPGGGENLNANIPPYGPVNRTTSNGSATVSLNAGTKAGTVEVQANSGAINSGASRIIISSGPPANMIINHELYSSVATLPGGFYQTTVGVIVSDTFANPSPDSTAIYFSLFTDTSLSTQYTNATIVGSAFITGGSGVATTKLTWPSLATFDNIAIYAETQGKTVADTIGVSLPITNGTLTFTNVYASTTVDSALGGIVPVTVQLKDGYTTIANGTISFNTTVGTVAPLTDLTDENGLASTTWTIPANASGTPTITAVLNGTAIEKSVTITFK